MPFHSSMVLSDILHARMAGGMGDVLLLFLDAGISIGMGLPLELPSDPTMAAMLEQVINTWYDQTDTLRAQYTPAAIDPIAPDWLLSLPRQVVPEGDAND